MMHCVVRIAEYRARRVKRRVGAMRKKTHIRCPACGQRCILIPLAGEAEDRARRFVRACPWCLPVIVRLGEEDARTHAARTRP
jgi:hypothetical protein